VDEATASVDLETDRRMQEIIGEHFRDCTVIAVAHRLQGIRDFDQVAVFEGGRVVEVGEPGELLKVEGGKFRGLWEGGREVVNVLDG
jgi:ATP-binding cassette subfamily C (CFTR/MRP) protein 1